VQLPAGLRLSVEDAPSRADRKVLDDALDAMNRPFFGGAPLCRVCVFVRDGDDKIVAGLDGMIEANWLYIDNLWVDGSLRGQGIGSRLMAEIERIAVERGCHSAWGTGLLPQAWLRDLRDARLSARTQALFSPPQLRLAAARDLIGVPVPPRCC